MVKASEGTACLVPACTNRADVQFGGRGLCPQCYCAAAHQVRKGTMTWAELEGMGLARQARRGRPLSSPFAVAYRKAKGE